MARPGFRPLLTEVEATWYMEIEKASAIQKPRRDGHVHVRSGEPNGTGSCSLLVDIWSSEPFEYADWTASRCLKLMLLMIQYKLGLGPNSCIFWLGGYEYEMLHNLWWKDRKIL